MIRFLLIAYLSLSACLGLVAQEETFPSKGEALVSAFPSAVRAWQWRRILTKEESAALEKRLHRRLPDAGYLVFMVEDGEGPCGLAVITAEIGKTEYFTFLVAVGLDRRVRGIEVLDYPEPRGGEIRRRSFREQFLGHGLEGRFRLRREIENVPGATLSAAAVIRGVRKVLAVVDLWFRGQKAEELQLRFRKEGKEISLPARVGNLRRFSFKAMGTICVLALEGVGEARAQGLAAAVREEMQRTESMLSNWSEEGELSKVLARAASGNEVPLSKELYQAVESALRASAESEGAFDPTIHPALQRQGNTQPERETLCRLVGYQKVTLHPESRSLSFLEPGMGFSSDAFAKGVAVDRAVALLRRKGLRRGRVGFRSTFFLLGKGHKVPLGDGRVLRLGDCAVSASASDDRPGHILDPRTLQPAVSSGTVVVIARTAFAADWLSTAAYVLGRRETRRLLLENKRDGRRFYFLRRGPSSAN